jgi:hypothetical protein
MLTGFSKSEGILFGFEGLKLDALQLTTNKISFILK